MSLRATIGVVNDREILLVVRSFDLVRILNGERTALLRNTLPKDFVGWVNLYCAKAKPYLVEHLVPKGYNGKQKLYLLKTDNIPILNDHTYLNGKVVARFWFDDWEKISFFSEYKSDGKMGYVYMQSENDRNISRADFLRSVCLTEKEVVNYTGDNGKPFYAWHIKNLEIFDTPKELSEFKVKLKYISPHGLTYWKAVETPHNWLYVYRRESV